jgi:hypothetical protein
MLSVQQYPYRAVRGIRGEIHRSAEIHKKACGWRWRHEPVGGCVLALHSDIYGWGKAFIGIGCVKEI